MRGSLMVVLVLSLVLAGWGGVRVSPFVVAPALADRAELAGAAEVKLEGFLGARCAANESNRLVKVEEEPLLAGYRKKPGAHPWIGEHAGKWLHAATLAWANSGDPELRDKLDRFAAELVKTQEPDGYIGTYVAEKRFGLFEGADWDVWSHKYCMIGLLTYYQYTGETNALNCCKRACALLITTFGPGKKSILSAGTHMGMAATSVLEPVVLLYRFTGDARYLEFAKYIVASWDGPKGPQVLATLLAEKNVRKTANAKAYEMLSNLVGLCELARVTGDTNQLAACFNAWDDITAHRIYLTGSMSSHEHFQDDFVLPNGGTDNICETCVSVTWLQFNAELLRLTGEARFANEIERTLYNHLAAAQRPDGAAWCYYTPLEGVKPYGRSINCCLSSGPRGMAMAPTFAWLRRSFDGVQGVAVNTFDSSEFRTTIDGRDLTFTLHSGFPLRGEATLEISGRGSRAAFPVAFRIPAWARPVEFEFEGKPLIAKQADGWAVLPARAWHDGDRVSIRFALHGSVILGDHGNEGRAAMAWGPFVLAYDNTFNPGLPSAGSVALAGGVDGMTCEPEPGGALRFAARFRRGTGDAFAGTLVPYADAGAGGTSFRVWLPQPFTSAKTTGSLFETAIESRSRAGNLDGSIVDGGSGSIVCTFDGTKAGEDWYAATLAAPVTITRVVFGHGRSFHDGGWFDASAGRPRIQIQRQKNAAWETIAELQDYPATTATDNASLPNGKKFTQKLPQPVTALAIRIIGKPATGDDPGQSFSSCSVLQAFSD